MVGDMTNEGIRPDETEATRDTGKVALTEDRPYVVSAGGRSTRLQLAEHRAGVTVRRKSAQVWHTGGRSALTCGWVGTVPADGEINKRSLRKTHVGNYLEIRQSRRNTIKYNTF
ncbi:hypothetical protein KIN20_020083 [Parelaphostrongylus tenuis]|uniref:Uncharacterized protein n=1 Tax=Parelaphostrongylus tenuis TaxID=148309 RepID=A0AAD5MLY3_PARTN|nr:hypothetical protein KIN20_020083 [Parelaphostrongylus tenuis]